MRAAVNRCVRTAAALAVGAALVTGCGGGAEGSAAAFGGEAVGADLDAAGEAVGLSGGEKAGTPTYDGPAGDPSDGPPTAEERRRKDLMNRMAACSVAWMPVLTKGAAAPAETERRFGAVLAALAERGWTEHKAVERTLLDEEGFVLMAAYKKRGWTLFAQHNEMGAVHVTSVTATEDACTARFTEEELKLLES
ncbi:hypothetical protein ACFUIZ_13760 [Streptomyces cinereoruber]|uniref:hypothetical protein n=1 Tax=Streptomyces cinereoruber TaxID=67260 RepID=UPI003625A119